MKKRRPLPGCAAYSATVEHAGINSTDAIENHCSRQILVTINVDTCSDVTFSLLKHAFQIAEY